jgi:hypothetical protein
MSDTPPRQPNYDRSVELPVAILRTIIVIVFIGLWVLLLRTDLFTRPELMSIPDSPRVMNGGALIFFGIPLFVFSFVIAMAFWEEAYTWVRKDYDVAVAAYDAYHAAIREQHAAAESARLHQRAIENEIKAQIAKTNQDIAFAQQQIKELS